MTTSVAKTSKVVKNLTSTVRHHLDAVERARQIYLDKIKRAENDYFDRIKNATAMMTGEEAQEADESADQATSETATPIA